jgi:hypothetical protein
MYLGISSLSESLKQNLGRYRRYIALLRFIKLLRLLLRIVNQIDLSCVLH